MPFKSQVIDILDYAHPYVRQFNSCNSIKIVDDELYGHNTDVAGAEYAISLFADDAKVAILGDGAMGTMFKTMLKDRATVYSRKLNNWEERYEANDVIINWGRPAQMSSLLDQSHGGLTLCDFSSLSEYMLQSIEFYTGGKAL
jgi:shikimate 5-dehydrogenase